jgi:polyisoprenoid-binding protein YceI
MSTTAEAIKTKWGIDPTHTEVQFKVKHLVISTVTGTFNKFNGWAEAEEENFNGADIQFSIEAGSIDTNQADRDAHLKSPDFFDAANHPTIEFKGKLNGEKLSGHLTMRGKTLPVTLKAELGGVAKDPWGNTKAGFEISGTVNRKEFGLNWNAVTEAGGVLVGEDVKILINAQLVKG